MINHVEGQINIEFRPVHMVGTQPLHVRDLLHGGFREPVGIVETGGLDYAIFMRRGLISSSTFSARKTFSRDW